jgi:pimeloyl-ACP methyl ester carboxylesterase
MDLRGHGETPLLNSSSQSSPPSGQSATLADAAADVAFTLNSIGIGTPDTVCGHSMVSALAPV